MFQTALEHYLENGFRQLPFAGLVMPFGAVVGQVRELHASDLGALDLFRAQCSAGALTLGYPHILSASGRAIAGRHAPAGAGASDVPAEAAISAVVEAAERYASSIYLEEEVQVASWAELGTQAIPIETIARCSAEEMEAGCPLRMPPAQEPIRWVAAWAPLEKAVRYVPLVMSHVISNLWRGERFWSPISTGIAAHTDPWLAVERAIYEAIERDCIALTWLLRRRLRRIQPASDAPGTDLHSRASDGRYSQFLHFDATTDLEVPTVYTLQLHELDAACAQIVSCSTGTSFAACCSKTVRECLNTRLAVLAGNELPADINQFSDLVHGATYMGQRERRPAFDFLTDTTEAVSLASLDAGGEAPVKERVARVLQRLEALGMHLYLIDLTTDDVREAGLIVVRAIVPELMPFSYVHRARYLGHPRLKSFAASIGADASRLNEFPQPFS